jgi:hypothetical protein
MRYVNVATVDDIYQAQFVSHALEVEGILCIQANEPTNTMLPYLRQGIQILVKETDYIRAKITCDKVILAWHNRSNQQDG